MEDCKIYDYDLIVMGAGSGGLALANEAARLGVEKICLFDYVVPSSRKTKWGFGGTCVNVGCIPKKLMHYAATIGKILHHDAKPYGWNLQESDIKHNWNTLVRTVQDYVKSLNFSYRVSLKKSIRYINATSKFIDCCTVSYEKDNQLVKVTGKIIVIAVGSRPIIPDNVIDYSEIITTSDDIFSLQESPGKTLIVGGSYIALECAGFLHGCGLDVTIAVRSIVLRGFDRQCSEMVASLMEEMGINFLKEVTVKSLSKLQSGKIEVQFDDGKVDVFDTVLYATGRKPDTDILRLQVANVIVHESGKIPVDKDNKTNVPNIYAIGDCCTPTFELTPFAIKVAECLANRIFGNSNEFVDMNLVPTTVFAPVEYAFCGLSEEDAIKLYGPDNVEVFLKEFSPIEVSASHRLKHEKKRTSDYDTMSNNSLSKLVCVKTDDTKDDYIVKGCHYVGENAGEVLQGFALALSLNAKKSDFDRCMSIHPTSAESFMSLRVTRSSNESWVASGGCGGGRCG